MKEDEKVNAVQRKNSQREFDSKKERVSAKIEIMPDPTIEREPSENQEISLHPNQISILIAEDDEFYFDYIETVLFSFDYKIIHAKNGQEAVNIYGSKNDIKLILMDIQMPVMDGFTATKEIRKINSEVPIIAQSSYSINGVKKKAINSGCNEFLLKPAEPEVLIRKFENYLKLTDQSLTS